MIHCADQNDLKVADTNASLIHSWLIVSEIAKSTLLVLTVFEHQENLKDHSLVFVASRHLQHEQKDAKFVKVKTTCKLNFSQVSFGHPLFNISQYFLHMHLL